MPLWYMNGLLLQCDKPRHLSLHIKYCINCSVLLNNMNVVYNVIIFQLCLSNWDINSEVFVYYMCGRATCWTCITPQNLFISPLTDMICFHTCFLLCVVPCMASSPCYNFFSGDFSWCVDPESSECHEIQWVYWLDTTLVARWAMCRCKG